MKYRKFIYLLLIFVLITQITLFVPAKEPDIDAANFDGYIVKLKSKPKLSAMRLFTDGSINIISEENELYLAKTQDDVDTLKRNADVEYIEPNYEVHLLEAPTDTYYSQQWGFAMTETPAAWDIGCYGNEVKIGVIDSGVYMHSDLSGCILPGYNYLEVNTDISDKIGHGTFVSGIIGARKNGVGIVGVAYKTKIVPLKCFTVDKSTYEDTIIAALNGAYYDFGCEIINMSFGFTNNSKPLEEVIDNLASKGVIMVASAGNDGTETMYYPAGYNNVIGVGAVASNKNIYSGSERNTSVYVTAPGESVWGLNLNNNCKTGTGTSFSAPFVTAMAAIYKNIDGNINIDKMKFYLKNSAEDLGTAGYDTSFGHGLVNIRNFVNLILQDNKMFTSPIDKNENISNVVILNNAEQQSTSDSIFVSYNNGKLNQIQKTTTVLNPRQTVQTYFISSDIDVKHFLWESLYSMIPSDIEYSDSETTSLTINNISDNESYIKINCTLTNPVTINEYSQKIIVMAYNKNDDFETVQNIKYLDQITPSINTDNSFDIKIPKKSFDYDITYTFRIGGTNIAQPTATDYFNSMPVLSGKVTVNFGSNSEIEINLYRNDETKKTSEFTNPLYSVKTDNEGNWEIENVADSDYTFIIGKSSTLKYRRNNLTVNGADIEISNLIFDSSKDIVLYTGDIDSNGQININDLSKLLEKYNKIVPDEPSDLDKNGQININDLSALLSGYNKFDVIE